mmetsp:Transcript_122816/g.183751  ORF Transcript_122816/g.183751 Transcript_122816/m.183751 type:complete len:95 (-) Transcript_122816:87-371(-)
MPVSESMVTEINNLNLEKWLPNCEDIIVKDLHLEYVKEIRERWGITDNCPNPCYGINCNNGKCIEGTCECEKYFSGSDCSVNNDPCKDMNCNNG